MGTPATRAKTKWNRNHYDQLKIIVPKGNRETIRKIAVSKKYERVGICEETHLGRCRKNRQQGSKGDSLALICITMED